MSWFSPDVIVLLASVTYVLGYLIINQVALRIVVLVGTLLYIWYYFVAAETPLWTAIWTSTANCIAIVIGLIVLLLARSHWSIPKDGLEIFKSHPAFAHIPPGDFRAVFKEASRYRVSSDTQITIEGEHCDHFFYLVDGSASAQKLGQTFDLPGGIFIGEVAYLLDQPSSATITVKSGTEVLSWSIPDVRARARRK
ncbi:MAG: cyclic nucleotide-binding domain-containing protein, partial [Boseongicola sp.]|nr:cyclic nucleotide-binding domain-containing protein [Boseongicola sp.]